MKYSKKLYLQTQVQKFENSSQINEIAIQEAKFLNQLDHPNIVKVKHLIQLNNQVYIGMEYVKCG